MSFPKALLKAIMSSQKKHLYEFGEFRLDTAERLLLREGKPVVLSPKLFDTLVMLVQNSGHLLDRDRLMKELWPDAFVEDVNLSVNISALRKMLGEGENGESFIETVPKRGYRFTGKVSELESGPEDLIVHNRLRARVVTEEGETNSIVGQAELDHAKQERAYLVGEIKRHKGGLAITAAAAIMAFAAVAYFYFPKNNSSVPSGEAIDSVAVLPFVNASGDPNTEYLSDGISDSIINSLSQLPALKVMSLNSVLRYKGKQIDPQAVGRELNVRAVLISRLTKRGDDLAITTELVDVRDNRRLWGGQYNRKLSDILVVQAEIAQEISQNLRLRLSAQEKKQLAKHYTENTEAYRLYSLGKYGSRGAAGGTKEGLEKSIGYFEQAIKEDPNYALAYVGLYGVYHELGFRGFWIPKEAWQRAEWAALKAVELDDTLAEAHDALAEEKLYRDWTGAEKEFKRALELDPNSVDANRIYAFYLVYSGRSDEALVYAKRAEELDSRNPSGLRPANLPYMYFLARKYDTAIEGYLRALEKNPNNAQFHFFLGEAYVAKGMHREGVAELQKAVALDNAPERWDRYPVLAYAYAVSGNRDEALKILNEQKQQAKQSYISPYNFAIIYTGLGDTDRAFEYLNRAYDERVYVMNQFPGRPMFDSLRSDPRYKELLRRMNRGP